MNWTELIWTEGDVAQTKDGRPGARSYHRDWVLECPRVAAWAGTAPYPPASVEEARSGAGDRALARAPRWWRRRASAWFVVAAVSWTSGERCSLRILSKRPWVIAGPAEGRESRGGGGRELPGASGQASRRFWLGAGARAGGSRCPGAAGGVRNPWIQRRRRLGRARSPAPRTGRWVEGTPGLTLASRIGSALERLEDGSGTDVHAATLGKPRVNSLLSDRIGTWVAERLQFPISLPFPITGKMRFGSLFGALRKTWY